MLYRIKKQGPPKRLARGCFVLGVVCALSTLAGTTSAQPETAEAAADSEASPVDRARDHFLRGVEFYRESDYRAAIIEFERAYKTAPNYKILYNTGQAYLEIQDYAAALDAFERFVSEGGDQLTPEQKQAVQREIDKLSGRIARVNVTLDVPGATVLIDDVVVGETPLAKPITLSTGRRKLTIQKRDYIPITQRIDVAGGDNLDLSFHLTRIEQAPAQAAPPARPMTDPAQERERGMGTPFWASLEATSVFAAGSGVLGVMALNAQADNDDQLNASGVSKNDLEDSKSKVGRYALGADILLGATVLAGGLTLYFALDSDAPSPTNVGLGPGGASVSGCF